MYFKYVISQRQNILIVMYTTSDLLKILKKLNAENRSFFKVAIGSSFNNLFLFLHSVLLKTWTFFCLDFLGTTNNV